MSRKKQKDRFAVDRVASVPLDKVSELWEIVGQYYDLWLVYPDLMVDMLATGTNFSLYFYQRIYLRACFRYRYFFATFTRAFSKSFLAILALILRCILLPKSKVFLVAESKEQAAGIFREKFTEIVDMMPLLRNELSTKMGERPNLG